MVILPMSTPDTGSQKCASQVVEVFFTFSRLFTESAQWSAAFLVRRHYIQLMSLPIHTGQLIHMRTEIFTAPHEERGESRRGSAFPLLRCPIKEGVGGPAARELHSTEPKNEGFPHL